MKRLDEFECHYGRERRLAPPRPRPDRRTTTAPPAGARRPRRGLADSPGGRRSSGRAARIADLGAGAGLPGPGRWRSRCPDGAGSAVESVGAKCGFLERGGRGAGAGERAGSCARARRNGPMAAEPYDAVDRSGARRRWRCWSSTRRRCCARAARWWRGRARSSGGGGRRRAPRPTCWGSCATEVSRCSRRRARSGAPSTST